MPSIPKYNRVESPIAFRLQKIRTVQFAFEEDFQKGESEIKTSAQLAFGAHPQLKRVLCLFEYKMFSEEKSVLKLEVSCEFTIEEEAWNNLLNDGKLFLPVDFGRHLGVITVGTSRGILHAKTENTPFASYPIPLINLFDKLQEDIKISV